VTSAEPVAEQHPSQRARALTLRFGISLWVLSWVPLAAMFGWTGTARIVTWTVQVVIGLIGLAFAGREFAQIVRQVGWRRAPRIAGVALWRGRVPAAATTPPSPASPLGGDAPATPPPPSPR
jgi:hypothetical protein